MIELDRIENWLVQNEMMWNEATIFVFGIGFVILGLVNLICWSVLVQQHDRTKVGRNLKKKKFFDMVLCFVLFVLYGTAWWATSWEWDISVWHKIMLRMIGIISIGFAALFGVRFVHALLTEDWEAVLATERELSQNTREVDQNAREVRQDNRDLGHMTNE